MKRLLAAGLLLLALSGLAHGAFGIFQTYAPTFPTNSNLRQENMFGLTGSAWNNFTGNYTPGLGNPAVATDDFYHQNGISGFRPYDLLDPSFTGACATAGAAIAATAGKGRYVWPLFPDHGDGGSTVWNNSFRFRLGYSNDPGVFPTTMGFFSPVDLSTTSPTISTVTASISNGSGGAGNILNVTAYTGLIPYSNSRATVSGAGVTTASITAGPSNGQTGNYTINGAAQLVVSQTMTISANGSYGLYYNPSLICNPDDVTTPFWISGEGNWSNTQHVNGVIKSADLTTWTTAAPTHNPLDFGTWSSFQRINRIGTGSWNSKGYQAAYPQNGNVFARSTWTSTDGLVWAPGTINLNQCIPASAQVGTTTSCTGSNVLSFDQTQSPTTITVGGSTWIMGKFDTYTGGSRVGNQYVGRASVDANLSVIDTPAPVMVSSAYAGEYPGPSYLQTVTGYVEDGIAHYYAVKGWPISNGIWFQAYLKTYANNGACAANPTINGQVGFFQFTGSSSGTTLTVSALGTGTIQLGSLIYGNGISNGANVIIVNQIGGTPNGVGTYTISVSTTVGSGTISGSSCGGLWQSNVDYLTEVIDSSAAAGAAPVGVRASCSGSTATINWYSGALPTDTMRLYRGTTAGSQPTLVGNFTGGVATDTGMTLNSVTYYKMVYVNSGVEQKNRVVSTYCSASSAFVNAHLTRALANGADATTCNRTWMDTFDGWLTSNSRTSNLQFATMPEFCLIQNGSNQISKIFDMGTTRLPRGGDYTPTAPASTTYSATGINSKPAWVNGVNTAQGYYGGGLVNNIRRKTQITLFAAYKKPGTAAFTPLASGEVGTMRTIKMSHTSGTPGTISCSLSDATQTLTATAPVAGLATDVHTSTCTFDGTNLTAYSDAVAGTPVPGLVIPSPDLAPSDALTGAIGIANEMPFLGSGSTSSKYRASTDAYIFSNNEALSSVRAQMVFDAALTGGQITSLDTLVR